ncbi:hypothetical protein ONS95_005867 [Cadophora gregata]|uniref:uncharacterized protein n=1 Tax=Cadophora gregata TaxID=51156 RepID=UPI0026DAAF6B|nr:uncharacterized protein ONS95_005867 [Cadophora gregata]KAK0102244.1 hypothetical protein ONS95_005867 [Cadophora gregata]KAK0103871.1 hypothetical protein ONS96_004980 [Cadophora gregata f. sp. sojae]
MHLVFLTIIKYLTIKISFLNVNHHYLANQPPVPIVIGGSDNTQSLPRSFTIYSISPNTHFFADSCEVLKAPTLKTRKVSASVSNPSPVRHTLFEHLPQLKDLPKITPWPPMSPNTVSQNMEHNSNVMKPAPTPLQGSAKPFVPQAQARPSFAPPSPKLNPLVPEFTLESEIGSSGLPVGARSLNRTVHSQEMIRDLVRLALQNAAELFQESHKMEVLCGLIAQFHELENELLDILKFGDPRDYTAAITAPDETLHPDQARHRMMSAMQYTSKFSRVLVSIQRNASYAAFPISNNLIILARIVKNKSTNSPIRPLEMAELLLEDTEVIEADAPSSKMLVIGKDMLNSYVKKLSRTRKLIGWTGWYQATEFNRKANYEMALAEDDLMTRQAGGEIDAVTSAIAEVEEAGTIVKDFDALLGYFHSDSGGYPQVENISHQDNGKESVVDVWEVIDESLPHLFKESIEIGHGIRVDSLEKEAQSTAHTPFRDLKRPSGVVMLTMDEEEDEGIAWGVGAKEPSENDHSMRL